MYAVWIFHRFLVPTEKQRPHHQTLAQEILFHILLCLHCITVMLLQLIDRMRVDCRNSPTAWHHTSTRRHETTTDWHCALTTTNVYTIPLFPIQLFLILCTSQIYVLIYLLSRIMDCNKILNQFSLYKENYFVRAPLWFHLLGYAPWSKTNKYLLFYSSDSKL